MRESKTLLKQLRKKIKERAGKRCKDFNFFCYACECWMAYDILEDMLEG